MGGPVFYVPITLTEEAFSGILENTGAPRAVPHKCLQCHSAVKINALLKLNWDHVHLAGNNAPVADAMFLFDFDNLFGPSSEEANNNLACISSYQNFI